jgi:hypothetical protein
MTSSGIESATFRFPAQCLNQLHYHAPESYIINNIYCIAGIFGLSVVDRQQEKTKHAHMEIEIKENATRTNTN